MRRHRVNLIIILFLIMILSSCKSQNSDMSNSLLSVEKTLGVNEKNKYELTLNANESVHIVIKNQNNIELIVVDPDGTNILDINGKDQFDNLKDVMLLAKKTGLYTLNIVSKVPTDSAYKISISNKKSILSEEERHFLDIQNDLIEANKLRGEATKESLSAAIEKYKKASEYFHATNNTEGEAYSLQGLLATYTKPDENVAELEKKLILLWQQCNNKLGESQTCDTIGLLFYYANDMQNSLHYFQRELALVQELGDKNATQAALTNIGSTYWNIDDNQNALEYYNRALAIAKEIKSINGESNVYHDIASVYDELGDYEKAIEYYEKTLSIEENKADKEPDNIGTSLYMMGRAYTNQGDPKKGFDLYNQALPLIIKSKDYRIESFLRQNLAAIYANTGEIDKSLDMYKQAFDAATSINDQRSQALTLAGLGNLYFSLQDYKKSLEHYNKSATLSQQIQDLEIKAPALLGKAKIFLAMGDLIGAQRVIEDILPTIESSRKKLDSPKLRANYFGRRRDYYDIYVDILMRLKRVDKAFEICEQGRARTLLESLAESEKGVKAGVDAKLLEREKTLSTQLNLTIQSQIQLLSDSHTKEDAQKMAGEINSLKDQLQFLEIEIRKKNPQYAALKYPSPITIKELQNNILDENTTLIEYLLGEDAGYIWLVNNNSTQAYTLPKRSIVNSLAKDVYDSLTTRSHLQLSNTDEQKHEIIAKGDEEFIKVSTELSELILKPILGKLKRKVIIVADGALYYVPFSALPGNQGKPLIFEHEIINAPSASVLQILHQRHNSRNTTDSIAVFADPVFDINDQRVINNKSNKAEQKTAPTEQLASLRGLEDLFRSSEQGLNRGNALPRLIFTRNEAQDIAAVFGTEKTMLALDFDASLTNLKSQKVQQATILHFATHGFINSNHPDLSGLVLSMVNKDGKPEIGILSSKDIFNLNLSAQLVTLSACSTGLGKEIRGEGLVGLTQGFFYAGAQKLIVSLWNVNDQATSLLMSPLYKKIIIEKKSPSESLRETQIELAAKPETASPYFWAGFTVQGDLK